IDICRDHSGKAALSSRGASRLREQKTLSVRSYGITMISLRVHGYVRVTEYREQNAWNTGLHGGSVNTDIGGHNVWGDEEKQFLTIATPARPLTDITFG